MAKKPLTPEERQERRDNWLAAAKSARERRLLEKLARQPHLSEEYRAEIRKWLAKPYENSGTQNKLFWRTAKKEVLGPVIYGMAMERHKRLSPREWMAAYLITDGFNQPEIKELMGLGSLRTLEYIIAQIKKKIIDELGSDDLNCVNEKVNLTQIGRWFLGQ